LQKESQIDLAKINRHKFLIRSIIETQVTSLRRDAISTACEQFLFDSKAAERVVVGGENGDKFIFDAVSYSPVRDYDVRMGGYEFKHHFYDRIGDFDSEEERLCAEYLDQIAEKGKIKYWVRNLEGKRPGAFFLQMATARFYPDFICVLKDGRILIVEYKGAHLWKESEGKRKIGNLWAEMSNQKCLFLMIKDKRWSELDHLIK